MFKFLHAADLHLDSPLRGLERYEGAPAAEIRSATRRALENLVTLACDEAVAFVLLAGDQYDGERDDYQTVLFFSRQMVRLKEAGIPVFAITGNHDAASKMTKSLRLPENVRFLSHKRPETVDRPELGVAIHGRGFARQAETANLVVEYPPALPDRFNIGLLHTALNGAEGYASYAPCTLGDLRAKQYDYWALGHVHERTIVAEDPWIVYPGNVQGRSIRELGARGCMLVTVHDNPMGGKREVAKRVEVEFRSLDVFRWALCDVPLQESTDADTLIDLAVESLESLLATADGRPLAVRMRLQGLSSGHAPWLTQRDRWAAELRAAAQRVAAEGLWIEKVQFETRPAPPVIDGADTGPWAEIQEYLADLRGKPGEQALLAEEFAELQKRIPAEVVSLGEGYLLSPSPAALDSMLNEVELLLRARLQGTEGPG
ncbi:MAG: exonuclease SbcCD subunit D [Pirellulaceae bacterium]